MFNLITTSPTPLSLCHQPVNDQPGPASWLCIIRSCFTGEIRIPAPTVNSNVCLRFLLHTQTRWSCVLCMCVEMFSQKVLRNVDNFLFFFFISITGCCYHRQQNQNQHRNGAMATATKTKLFFCLKTCVF